MHIVNTTPYVLGTLLGKLHFPNPSITVVVKGTFDLQHEAPACPAEEQHPFTGDTPEEKEPAEALRYPLDLIHFKPRADLLLVGSCHAGNDSVLSLDVTFRVGTHSKSLRVTGERFWQGHGASEPQPFRSMPLRYERAFGGRGVSANPVGMGLEDSKSAEGIVAPWLPNIEYPTQAVQTRSSRPDPAGFGPLRPDWAPRNSKLGSYGNDWLKTRWPWYPADFDWGHYNSAPADMQCPFLRGDEPISLSNLHRDYPQFESALPGKRVRCFVAGSPDGVNHIAEVGPKPETAELDPMNLPLLREVPLELDTLWIDTNLMKLVLVWRGVANTLTEDADELTAIYLTEQSLDTPPSSLETEQKRFETLLRAELDPDDLKQPIDSEAEPSPDQRAEQLRLATEETEFEKKLENAVEQSRQSMIRAGLDPDKPVQLTAQQQEEQRQYLATLGISAEDLQPAATPEPEPWTRERVQEATQAKRRLSQENLSSLDLSGLDLSGVDFSGALLSEANFTGALLSGANLSGTDLTGARLDGVKAEQLNLTDSLLESTSWHNAQVAELQGAGVSAYGADFSGAQLSDAHMPGADLEAAILENTNLAGANLEGATLEAVRAEGLNAERANLTGVNASEGARFGMANFSKVKASGSNWEGADLNQSNWYFAQLDDVNFSSARLVRAALVGARMRSAKLIRADLRAARLLSADLFEANLERADLTDADFSGASLYAAQLLNSRMVGTAFERADLNKTSLSR